MSKVEKFWGSFGIIVLVISNWLSMGAVQKMRWNLKESVYCGTIRSTDTKETAVKHGSQTDLYVLVDFDGIGERAIETTPTTYYTAVPGNRICFSLSNEQIYGRNEIGMFDIIWMSISTLGDLILFFLLIDFIIRSINKMLSDH